MPSFSWLVEQGGVCALNFPVGMNAGLAKAIGVMMKLDFERAVLNRIPQLEAEKTRHFRQVLFLCDEYQHFATVGENEPSGDEKFFTLSRQAKCIPIVATQSISSLKTALPGETWRTLLQTFRTKIFLALADDFSAKVASELCGQDEKWRLNYNISESGHDSRVSYLTGKPLADKAHISTSKTYSQQRDYRFDMKTFTELRNAQSITLAYDGLDPMPPMFCYLKPYFNDVNKSYFQQLAEELVMHGFEMILPFLRPIQHLILDPDISEIMVNGPERVFVERAGFVKQVPDVTLTKGSLLVAVKNIARRLGDDISEARPILDSRLPDGSRVAAVIPPCSSTVLL